MIPRLYEADESSFSTNGLGSLPDAIKCEVDEALNGAYELYMEYPVTGVHADDLTVGRFILAKPNDISQDQPFRIYSVTEELTGIYTVNAQHISYDLSGYPVSVFNAVGVTPALTGLVSNTMVANPFTVWTDINNTDTSFALDAPQTFRACLGGVQGSILDRFGGEYEFDRLTIKLHAHRGSDNGVFIRYAKNLEVFKNERAAEAYTGCLAYWTGSEDEESVSGQIQHVEDYQDYPVEKIFMLDASSDFDDPPTVDQLNARAAAYITANSLGVPFGDTMEISFVPLWQTEEYRSIASQERVSLGDTVHVVYRSYNVAMKMIEYRYDVLQERYISIVLGKKKASFADTVKQVAKDGVDEAIGQATSIMQQAIDHAADVLSGGTGGYVVIGRNANGEPNELYIMDTPDMGTAVNVMRMNYAGIAFSNSGVNGPWSTAWLLDSTFYADYITAGTFNGNLIQAGSVLTSALEVAVATIIDGIKMNFSFLNDGLHIAEKDAQGNIVAAYQTLVSNLGLRVIETASNTPSLIAEGDSVTASNLTADQYLRVRANDVSSRFQQFYSSVHQEYEFGIFWEV